MPTIGFVHHKTLMTLATLYGTYQTCLLQEVENAVDATRRMRIFEPTFFGQVYVKLWRANGTFSLQISDNGIGMNPVIGRYHDAVEAMLNFQTARLTGKLERLSESELAREYMSRWRNAAPGLCSFEYMASHIAGSSKEGAEDQSGQKGIGFWSWLNFAEQVMIQSKIYQPLQLSPNDLPPHQGKVNHWRVLMPSRTQINEGNTDYGDPQAMRESLKDLMGRDLQHGTVMTFTGITDEAMRSIVWRLDDQLARAFEPALERGEVRITIIDQRDGKAKYVEVKPNQANVNRWWVDEVYAYGNEQLKVKIGFDPNSSGGNLRLFSGDINVCAVTTIAQLNVAPFNHPNLVGTIAIPRSPRARITLTSDKKNLIGDGLDAWAALLIRQYASRLEGFLKLERENLSQSRIKQVEKHIKDAFQRAVSEIRQRQIARIEFFTAEGDLGMKGTLPTLVETMVSVETKYGKKVPNAIVRLSRLVREKAGAAPRRVQAMTKSGVSVNQIVTGSNGRASFGELPYGEYQFELVGVPEAYERASVASLTYRFELTESSPGYWYRFTLIVPDEPIRPYAKRKPTEPSDPDVELEPEAPLPSLNYLKLNRPDRYVYQPARNEIVINMNNSLLVDALQQRNGPMVAALLANYFASALAEIELQRGEIPNEVNRRSVEMYETFLRNILDNIADVYKRRGKTI